MKKGKVLHGDISGLIAEMAHTDTILIGDAGMPVPEGVWMIDLALTEGMVPFMDVVKAVMAELCVEKAYITEEMEEKSPAKRAELLDFIDGEFEVEEIPHEDLKKRSEDCKAVIRTGEFTPYANIMLQSGVLF